MWDCHSCDPGSNPGPGVTSSVRIPTLTNNNDNKEINNQTLEIIKIQNQDKNNKYKNIKLVENSQMRDLYRFPNSL
jgi:hypothetical protein